MTVTYEQLALENRFITKETWLDFVKETSSLTKCHLSYLDGIGGVVLVVEELVNKVEDFETLKKELLKLVDDRIDFLCYCDGVSL
ncbi:MAG: hypothetical protein IPJ79_06885 [Bacteroidetes bacterium]|nr:hypothetical protein [Bacteroidota bacterium]